MPLWTPWRSTARLWQPCASGKARTQFVWPLFCWTPSRRTARLWQPCALGKARTNFVWPLFCWTPWRSKAYLWQPFVLKSKMHVFWPFLCSFFCSSQWNGAIPFKLLIPLQIRGPKPWRCWSKQHQNSHQANTAWSIRLGRYNSAGALPLVAHSLVAFTSSTKVQSLHVDQGKGVRL